MKNILIVTMLCICCSAAPSGKLYAQLGIIKRIIRAMDLAVQRLQNKTIWLQQAQKAIENEMTKLRLNEISDWVEKQRVLYQDYFDELKKVKNVIAYYHRVKEVGQKQVTMINAWKKAFALFRNDSHFTVRELVYMEKVYTGIIAGSASCLEQLGMVIRSFDLQMTDESRLELLEAAADALDKNYNDLFRFTTQNKLLSLQRARDMNEARFLKQLYNLP